MELSKLGFTISNHGESHQNFNTLSFDQQKMELTQVDNFLAEKFGIENSYFCFPYGDEDIEKQLFDWMYSEFNMKKTFGISGIKKDFYPQHFHRILMEYNDYSAEEIIQFEYFYYLMKIPFGKNKIKR